jgi:hypothetical protein
LIGPVDVQALKHALECLTARHGVLRTTICRRDGEYVQDRYAHPVAEVARSAAHGGVAQLTTELARCRLTVDETLAGEPLFRPAIHKEGHERHLLVFRIHHLLYDGMSFSILWRDLSELYAACRYRRAPELPELRLEYIDFARQQRGSWPDAKQRAVPFWRSLVAGATGEVDWPPPSEVSGHPYEHEVTRFELSPVSARAATAIARQHRVSPFFVLLSATAGAIAAATGCEDPLIGTDVANRGSRSKHDLVGHLVSSRLTRFVEPQHRPVAELVADARETWFAAEEFDDVYIGEVLGELGIPEYTPVVQLEALDPHAGPRLDEVRVLPVDVPGWPYYWRDALIIWSLEGRTFGCQMAFRRSRVAGWVPDAVAAAIEARLQDGG